MITTTTFGYVPGYGSSFSRPGLISRAAQWLFRSTPRKLTPAEEAADVRLMARSVERSDPGFAADLYAAAARHEGLRD